MEARNKRIQDFIAEKYYWIMERNKIMDNMFKYLNPYYRYKLKKIDKEIDRLDMIVYNLEKQT